MCKFHKNLFKESLARFALQVALTSVILFVRLRCSLLVRDRAPDDAGALQSRQAIGRTADRRANGGLRWASTYAVKGGKIRGCAGRQGPPLRSCEIWQVPAVRVNVSLVHLAFTQQLSIERLNLIAQRLSISRG